MMHSLIANTLAPLLYLTFKISRHEILLNNHTFALHNGVALIGLLSSCYLTFVLILIDIVISGFSSTLIIVFGRTLICSHSINIDRFFLLSHSRYVLTLIPSVDATDSIDASTTDGILISFLVLNESSQILHLLSVYVG